MTPKSMSPLGKQIDDHPQRLCEEASFRVEKDAISSGGVVHDTPRFLYVCAT
jgi:hypothetical protein